MTSLMFQGDFPSPDHDHATCVREALETADELCANRGIRLTTFRRQVLEIIWNRHSPIGAYEILDVLSDAGRSVTPTTVYRTIDFLLEQGLIHRVESLKAFIGCVRPDEPHEAQFFICGRCRTIANVIDPAINAAISERAADVGFTVDSSVVEVVGTCPHCRKRDSLSPDLRPETEDTQPQRWERGP